MSQYCKLHEMFWQLDFAIRSNFILITLIPICWMFRVRFKNVATAQSYNIDKNNSCIQLHFCRYLYFNGLEEMCQMTHFFFFFIYLMLNEQLK